jgi:outer membrane protein assembly factor BamB
VAFFGSEGLFVYDVEGNLRWRRNLGVLDAGYVGLPDYQWETASSPLIYRDLVIVQCDSRADSFMVAFDLADGKEVWRQERDENPSWATPVVARAGDRDLIVTSSPRFFRATDPLTGEEVWRVADDADVKVPTPVSGHGLVVFSGGAPQGRPFIAVRLDVPPDAPSAEGAPDRVAWRVEKGSPYTPTPILYGDYLYVLSDNGILSCYEARTGREVYRQRVPDVGGTYSASPVVADGRLYLSHADGTVYVVRAGPTFELIATNPMGEVLMATPAMAPGILLIRTQSHLVALTGTPPGDLPG